MFYMPSFNSGNKQALKSRIAFVLLICFVIVFLLSKSFIITRTLHEHDCGPAQERSHNKDVYIGCDICARIQKAVNILKLLGIAAACIFFTITGLFVISAIYKSIFLQSGFQTLISLKVRMNN